MYDDVLVMYAGGAPSSCSVWGQPVGPGLAPSSRAQPCRYALHILPNPVCVQKHALLCIK